jgi:hypothetical protein
MFLSLYPKNFGYSLGGYSHREKEVDRKKTKRYSGAIDYLSSATNFDFIVNKIKIDYSHWELFMKLSKGTTQIFCTFQHSNKAATYDSQVMSS